MKQTVRPRSAPALPWDEVVAALPDLCTVLDPAGTIVVAPPDAFARLRRDARDLVGRSVCDLIPLHDRRNCTTWLRSVLDGHEPPELVHGLIRGDGEIVPHETRLRLLSRGGRRLVVAVSRDVAARLEFDRHLTGMSRLWNGVCDTVREGVLVLTEGGLVIGANSAAADLLGHAPGALVGRDVDELLVTDDDPPAPLDASTLHDRHGCEFVVGVAGRRLRLRARATTVRDHDPADPGAHLVVVLEPLSTAVPATPTDPDPDSDPDGRRNGRQRALSRRETEVLQLLIAGRDVRAISRELDISVHTTRTYVRAVLKKLDARTQLQAVVVALRCGLVDLP